MKIVLFPPRSKRSTAPRWKRPAHPPMPHRRGTDNGDGNTNTPAALGAAPSTITPSSPNATLITYTPYTSSSSTAYQPLQSTSPNWPIYLGLTLGTLALACTLSLVLWIRSRRAKRTVKARADSVDSEPLPLYQAFGVSVPVVGPPPPPYVVVADARGAPPEYVGREEMRGQVCGVVVVGDGMAGNGDTVRP